MRIKKCISILQKLFSGAKWLLNKLMHVNIFRIIKNAFNAFVCVKVAHIIIQHIRNHRVKNGNTIISSDETTTEKIFNTESNAVNANGKTKKEEHDETIQNIYKMDHADASKDGVILDYNYNYNQEEAKKAKELWKEMHANDADDTSASYFGGYTSASSRKKIARSKKKEKKSRKKSQRDIVSVSSTDAANTRRYPGTDPRISDEDMDKMCEAILKAEERRQKHLDPCDSSPTRGYGVYEPYDPDAVFDFSKPYMIRRDENGNEYYAHPWDNDVVAIWRNIGNQNFHPRKPPYRRFYVDPKVNYAIRNTWNPDRDYQKILKYNEDNPEVRVHKDALDFVTKTPTTDEEWDYLETLYWKAQYEDIGAFIRHRNTPWDQVPYNVEDYRFIVDTDFSEFPFKDMAVSDCYQYSNC